MRIKVVWIATRDAAIHERIRDEMRKKWNWKQRNADAGVNNKCARSRWSARKTDKTRRLLESRKMLKMTRKRICMLENQNEHERESNAQCIDNRGFLDLHEATQKLIATAALWDQRRARRAAQNWPT